MNGDPTVSAIQPWSYQAFNQGWKATYTKPGCLPYMTKVSYGLLATLVAPIGGVAYHAFKALQNVCRWDRPKGYRHLRAMGRDLVIGAVSLCLLGIAIKEILVLPAVFKAIAALNFNQAAFTTVEIDILIRPITSLFRIGLPFIIPVVSAKMKSIIIPRYGRFPHRLLMSE